MQNNLRSLIFRKFIGNKIFTINKPRLNKLSLVYFKKKLNKNFKPVSELYLESGENIGVKDDNLGLELWMPEEKGKNSYPPFKKIINFSKLKKIAIAPGANYYTKRWPAERFAELAGKLVENYNFEIFILGGEKDKQIGEYIKIANIDKHSIFDCTNSSSIIDTTRVIDNCSLLITNDTGVMHIASARQTPVIALFGSSVRDFGFSPYRVKNIILEKNVKCRPCSHIGRNYCPEKHFKCMLEISINDVLKAVQEIIGIYD